MIDTACARALAGTHWFEDFEVELKRHATLVEVLHDNETFRFGPGAVKLSPRAVIFPIAVGQNVFLLRASLLDEEVPLLISTGAVKQLGSVIDWAQKTIEFRSFSKYENSTRSCSWSLADGSQAKARFFTSETF